MRRDESKRIKAAEVYRATGNVSRAAKEAGVSRATLHRWLKDPEFLPSIPDGSPVPELKELREKALKVLDDALDGKHITTGQLRTAIEVTKASNSLKEPLAKPEGEASLEDLLALTDAESGDDEPD